MHTSISMEHYIGRGLDLTEQHSTYNAMCRTRLCSGLAFWDQANLKVGLKGRIFRFLGETFCSRSYLSFTFTSIIRVFYLFKLVVSKSGTLLPLGGAARASYRSCLSHSEAGGSHRCRISGFSKCHTVTLISSRLTFIVFQFPCLFLVRLSSIGYELLMTFSFSMYFSLFSIFDRVYQRH
jgi:hypothetical protein